MGSGGERFEVVEEWRVGGSGEEREKTGLVPKHTSHALPSPLSCLLPNSYHAHVFFYTT